MNHGVNVLHTRMNNLDKVLNTEWCTCLHAGIRNEMYISVENCMYMFLVYWISIPYICITVTGVKIYFKLSVYQLTCDIITLKCEIIM